MAEKGDFDESFPKIFRISEEAPTINSSPKVKKLSPNALLPSRASSLAAGYDLSSAAEVKVPARGAALVPTDINIVVPKNSCARIAPRSGLTLRHLIGVQPRIIDADSRGPVDIILFNNSDIDFDVKPGDRVAQLIIQKIRTPNIVEMSDFDEPSPKILKISEETPSITSSPKVKKLSPNAVVPSRRSSRNAGYDLFSAAEVKVPARGAALIPTDLIIALPKDTCGQISLRVELALKSLILVGAGVVDADYRGPVGVILFNHSDLDFNVERGDHVAQLVIQKIIMEDLLI